MINYTDKKSIKKLISLEKRSLLATYDIQQNLNKQILIFMKNFIGRIEINIDFDPENNAYYYLNESTAILNKSNTNISSIQKLLKAVDKLDESVDSLPVAQIKEKVDAYNKKFTTLINPMYKNTAKIENFLHQISVIDIAKLLKSSQKQIRQELLKIENENNEDENTITAEEIDTSFLEKTLIISEIQGKVILPYRLEKVKSVLVHNTDKYKSLQDVIDNLYTRPLDYYKVPSLSRFREAYKLVTEREHGSKIRALILASELFMNYNLHPAIISACRNVDQLDIYLACLEDNALDEFKFFSIKYEITPAVINDAEPTIASK